MTCQWETNDGSHDVTLVLTRDQFKIWWSEPAKKWWNKGRLGSRGGGGCLASYSGFAATPFSVCVFSTLLRVGPPFLQTSMFWRSLLCAHVHVNLCNRWTLLFSHTHTHMCMRRHMHAHVHFYTKVSLLAQYFAIICNNFNELLYSVTKFYKQHKFKKTK